jgi:hypothetical protein
MGPAELWMMSLHKLQSSAEQACPTSRQRQPESNAAVGGDLSVLPAAKGFEDTTGVTPVDPRTGIYNVNMNSAVFAPDFKEHGGVGRALGVTARVVDEDPRDLPDQVDIRARGLPARSIVSRVRRHATSSAPLLERLCQTTKKRFRVDFYRFELRLLTLQPRVFENILNQVGKPFGLLVQRIVILLT